MNNTTEVITLIMERTGASPIAAVHFAALVLAGLNADPEIQEMAEANDMERFVEGCNSPAFQHKFGTVLSEIREVVAA